MLFTIDYNQVYIVTAVAYAKDWENKKSILEQTMLSLVPLRNTASDSQTAPSSNEEEGKTSYNN